MNIISKPFVTVNKLPAIVPAGMEDQKILVIGQKLSTGSATEKILYEDVTKADVNTLFGKGSFLQNSLSGIFDVFQRSGSIKLPRVDVIPLDDVIAGVKATSTLIVSEVGGSTNAATVTGNIEVIIGSKFLYTFPITIADGQAIVTGTGNIADAIANAINDNDELPVTAVNVAGTITLTCRHKGTIGNGITFRVKGLSYDGANYVLGNVKIAITAFTGGVTDPTVTTILSVVGDKRYQTITHPIEYGIVFSVTNFLDNRFNVDNDIQDGVCIVSNTDTTSNLKTALSSLNSQSLVYFCNKKVSESMYNGSTVIDLDFVSSARFAAIRALRLTEDANIIRFVASNVQSKDLRGGKHISTLPYPNTPVYAISPIETIYGFTQTEIQELEDLGGSVMGNNNVGNQILLGDIVTTYKTDAQANPDPTWHYLETVDTLSISAEYMFNNLKQDFAQSRLTEGNLINGFTMVNEIAFKGQLKKYYIDLSEEAITPEGKDAVDYFYNNISTVIDMLNGRISATCNLPIVVQLREILVNLRTTFSIGG